MNKPLNDEAEVSRKKEKSGWLRPYFDLVESGKVDTLRPDIGAIIKQLVRSYLRDPAAFSTAVEELKKKLKELAPEAKSDLEFCARYGRSAGPWSLLLLAAVRVAGAENRAVRPLKFDGTDSVLRVAAASIREGTNLFRELADGIELVLKSDGIPDKLISEAIATHRQNVITINCEKSTIDTVPGYQTNERKIQRLRAKNQLDLPGRPTGRPAKKLAK